MMAAVISSTPADEELWNCAASEGYQRNGLTREMEEGITELNHVFQRGFKGCEAKEKDRLQYEEHQRNEAAVQDAALAARLAVVTRRLTAGEMVHWMNQADRIPSLLMDEQRRRVFLALLRQNFITLVFLKHQFVITQVQETAEREKISAVWSTQLLGHIREWMCARWKAELLQRRNAKLLVQKAFARLSKQALSGALLRLRSSEADVAELQSALERLERADESSTSEATKEAEVDEEEQQSSNARECQKLETALSTAQKQQEQLRQRHASHRDLMLILQFQRGMCANSATTRGAFLQQVPPSLMNAVENRLFHKANWLDTHSPAHVEGFRMLRLLRRERNNVRVFIASETVKRNHLQSREEMKRREAFTHTLEHGFRAALADDQQRARHSLQLLAERDVIERSFAGDLQDDIAGCERFLLDDILPFQEWFLAHREQHVVAREDVERLSLIDWANHHRPAA